MSEDTALAQTPRYTPGRGSQLTELQREEIRLLYLVDGFNISEIARRTGRQRETVGLVLKDEATKQLEAELIQERRRRAKQTLAAHVETAASAWTETLSVAAKKGDHRPARDLLLHEDVIKPVAPQGQGSVTIQIGVKDSDLVVNLGSPPAD